MANPAYQLKDVEDLEQLDGEVLDTEDRRPDVEVGISLEDFRSALRKAIDDAIDYAETDLEKKRLSAIEAYRAVGLPTDNSLDATRSRFMSRDVQDTINAILPSMLRIFFGGRDVVCYRPTGPEDEEVAKQVTKYVNQVVLNQDNDGFMIGYTGMKDALIKGLGTFMWWWDESYEITAQRYSGLSQEGFYALAGDPSIVEVYNYEQGPDGFIDCEVSREVSKNGGRVKIEAVPPEERLINRDARSIDDSTLYGRRQNLTVSKLVAMGYDYAQVQRHSGKSNSLLDTNEEAIERLDKESRRDGGLASDPSQRNVLYTECYVRADLDADGIAELYKVCCVGDNHEILEYDDGELALTMADDIPYAELCPDPEPHLATGHSISERVDDVQKAKSQLIRATFDSLSRAIFPREEVVESQVNMDDVLNPEIGATIRTKAPGMVREIVTTFMGKECLPLLAYMDDVKANRTGISAATQGLDPQILQSTTPKAVEATVSASQSQIEMIARIFAQTGIVRMFKGLYRLIAAHQDQPRTVRLTSGWAMIDPRSWEAEMDATVDVALGRGTDGERLGMLNAIALKQELIMTTLGPENGLCSPKEYRETLTEIISVAGYYNPDRFFMPIEEGQQIQQLAQKNQETEQQLQQAQMQIAQLQFELGKHSEAEDADKLASAGKKGAETIQTVVETAQLAAGATVPPGAARDELAAAGRVGGPG